MSFVSLAFLVFYPVVLVLYWLLWRQWRLQNGVVLIASLFFYGWWDWRFLGLLVFTSGLDYLVAQVIEDRPQWRRRALWLSITVNLGTLSIFKYFDFFAMQLNELFAALGFSAQLGLLNVLLPIGISFYTFQSMAYTIDVYRGVIRAERNPLIFFPFIFFFPQLVAGPIERASHLLPQFTRPRQLDASTIHHSLWLIVWGYCLKIVMADSAGAIADGTFQPYQHYGWSVILGTIAFGWQVFGDFCGYSYIAKGVAGLLGFEIVWNFRQPYWSQSVQEFWQRWHISLSTWLRDYLYIPLGSNRRGRPRAYANLMITMGLGGLWHGAGWNFILWGLLHGAALVVHGIYSERKSKRRQLPAGVAWLLTMLVVFTGWFFFRARSWELLTGMAAALDNWTWTPAHTLMLRALVVVALPVAVVEWFQLGKRGLFAVADAHWAVRAAANTLALITILALVDRARTEFIYFQF